MRDGGIRIWTGRLDRGSGGSGPDPRDLAGDDGDGRTWRRPRRSAVEEDAGLAGVAPGADPATQGGGGAAHSGGRRKAAERRRCVAEPARAAMVTGGVGGR